MADDVEIVADDVEIVCKFRWWTFPVAYSAIVIAIVADTLHLWRLAELFDRAVADICLCGCYVDRSGQ